MHALLLLATLSAVPTTQLTREVSPMDEGRIRLSSLPQLGLARAEGAVGLGRFELEVAGWGLFLKDTAGLTRGGWVGARFQALKNDAVQIDGTLRGFVANAAPGDTMMAGLGAMAESRIAVLSWFFVRPEFEADWVGPLMTARLSNEFLLRAGDWSYGLRGGGQLWTRDGKTIAAFGGSVAVGWRHLFGSVGVDLSGAVALARDPSFLLRQPVLLAPQEHMQLWGALSVSFFGREAHEPL